MFGPGNEESLLLHADKSRYNEVQVYTLLGLRSCFRAVDNPEY